MKYLKLFTINGVSPVVQLFDWPFYIPSQPTLGNRNAKVSTFSERYTECNHEVGSEKEDKKLDHKPSKP